MQKRRKFFIRAGLLCLVGIAIGIFVSRRDAVTVTQQASPKANVAIKKALSPTVVSALENSPTLTLYSIHWSIVPTLKVAQDNAKMMQPELPPVEEIFHNYPVLGKTTVSGPQKNALLQAFYDGIAKPSPMAGCFMPRHALRVQNGGKNFDFIICFSCSQFSSSSAKFNQPINPAVRPVFDAILQNAGIPIAK